MSRRPEDVYFFSFWDCSCRDFNLFQPDVFSCNSVLQYLREAQTYTPLFARVCDSPQLLSSMHQVVAVCTSEHNSGQEGLRKDLGLWQHSMDGNNRCLSVRAVQGRTLTYFYWTDLPDQSFCIKFPASMHEVAENQDINGSTGVWSCNLAIAGGRT